jgi:hypothetical protein
MPTISLNKFPRILAISLSLAFCTQSYAQDATSRKIVEIGKQDPQVMTWLDIITNRFGGRMTGSDNYNHAARWTRDQLKSWGITAELEEVGQVPVGFNRGPWFGKMVMPTEKTLRFGTPSYTAGTKGVQRGIAVLGPANEAEAKARLAEFKNSWVLIQGESRGSARDGRKEYKPDAVSVILKEAGALGTIQLGKEPLTLLDAKPTNWENLPTLPDIKLTADHYKEIEEQIKKGEKVELEFDIRNWFFPGPVPFHNVVAHIKGTENPDEYVVIAAHLDSFDSATGAVDDGSGFTPTLEAMRLLAKAGAKPKRSIVMIATAGEELGILGAASYTDRHAQKLNKIVMMLNRDGAPGAITGITVPSAWKPVFDRVANSLQSSSEEFGFEVKASDYPRVRAESLVGTDASAFSMKGVPTPSANNKTNFIYSRTWHTLNDTYNEVLPYANAQQHSAIATALIAYEVANAPESISRQAYYLPDGLYLELGSNAGNIMLELQSKLAPELISRLVGQVETRFKPAPSGPATPRPTTPPPAIGSIQNQAGLWTVQFNGVWPDSALTSSNKVASSKSNTLQVGINPQGQLRLIQSGATLPAEFTFIATVFAGQDNLEKIDSNTELRSARVIRVGAEAKAFIMETSLIR